MPPVRQNEPQYHQMSTYTYTMGGVGLRQGIKCSCGWSVSENNPSVAREHLDLEAAVIAMNREFERRVNPVVKRRTT